jgi:hypothetical protein
VRLRRWAAIPGALVAVTLTLAACVTARISLPATPVAAGFGVEIEARPVPLDPTDPARTAVGDFRYAGGVALTSDETTRLHGLSGLVARSDGRVFSVTDDGDYFTARLVLDGAGRLIGLAGAELRGLKGSEGEAVEGKEWADAEGLSLLPDGRRLVSFERRHRIWLYPPAGDGAPEPAPMPSVAMGENDGMEGLAATADGYWVGVQPGSIWFCRLQADCREIAGLPKPPASFRLSGLTVGPGGELIVLHHSYVPAIGSRIVVTVVHDPMGAKTAVGGFAMGPSASVDNFEGVAVVPKPNGDWRLYLLSDDNFSARQRTLLLAFDWTPPK